MSSDKQLSEDELKFQQAKAYLMQSDQDGQCVYDHLQNIVAEMMETNPNDVAHHPERLADLSSQLKKHKFTNGDASKSANAAAVTHHTQLAAAEANKELFEKPIPEVSTVVEKPTPYTTVTTTTTKAKAAPQFKSVVAENAMWKHCGAALPQQEAFLLDQSISRLCAQRKLEEVRFVGKILGINTNYIVISSKRFIAEDEKVYEEVYAMPKPPRKKVAVDVQPEPGYKGCNRLSFWVTPDANSNWTLLPDITPQQVNAARNIRKFFTGDLKATINAHPHFVGSEATYLRAQLSRILSSTYITPGGVLEKVEEEEEEAEEDEDGKAKGPKMGKYFALTKLNKEFEGETTAAFADPEQWVHSENYIYETGRQSKIPEKPEGDEEEEPVEEEDEEEDGEEKKEEEERELFLPIKKDSSYAIIRLPKEPNPEDEEEEPEEETPAEGEEEKEPESEKEEDEDEIADDDPLRKKIPAWTTRQTNTVYKSHAVVVVRSLRWPGAVAYASNKGKNFGAVYIGWGFKKTDTAFTPTAATEIIKEADDIVEMADPTAGNEKLVMRGEDPKEADSEDEKDEDEDEEDADN